MSLMVAALTEMARYYKLPVFGTAGCSDAPRADVQFACEAAFSCFASALSGAHLVHDVGFFYHAERISCASVVLADEIVGMTRAFMRGFSVDEETLAVDLIDRVGPQGHFLTEEHTLAHFREVWRPELFDRTMKGSPPAGKDFDARLGERTTRILEDHRPAPLDEAVEMELAKIERRLLDH